MVLTYGGMNIRFEFHLEPWQPSIKGKAGVPRLGLFSGRLPSRARFTTTAPAPKLSSKKSNADNGRSQLSLGHNPDSLLQRIGVLILLYHSQRRRHCLQVDHRQIAFQEAARRQVIFVITGGQQIWPDIVLNTQLDVVRRMPLPPPSLPASMQTESEMRRYGTRIHR